MTISKFEKFIIKHTEITCIVIVIILILLKSILMKHDFNFINTIPVVAIFVFAEGLCIFVTSNIRNRMNNFYSTDLNPDASILLLNQYLDITKKDNDIYSKINYYFDLMTYYSAKGEYEPVIDLCTKIRRDCFKKKIEKSYDLSLRLFLAHAYLNRREKFLYDKEIEYVREEMSKTKLTKHIIAHQFTEVRLLEESLYHGNDPKFETKVFDFLYEKNSKGKQKNKKPSNIQLISAYGLLLNYYKLNEEVQKATEYANKIIGMGNEQLAVYRAAKEYLDNANKGN